MASTAQRRPVRPYGGLTAAERVAARRELLLDAALELYGTRGYVSTGVKDICREAGLTDRYFYESFHDSGELFVAAFDRVTDDLLQLVARRVGETPPKPELQVRAAIETFVGALADDPRKARLIFAETASAGAEAERHMRASLRRFADLVVETSRPYVRASIPERVLRMGALSVVGAIERVVIEWQEGELDASVEEVIEFLIELALVGGASIGVRSGESPRGLPR